MIKITVAIACYNLEDKIATCLESVIFQDYQNVEILIVDDHSTDHSVDVLKKIIERHPERNIRLIVNETNLGLCKVRNISIDEACGDAIFFIDGDDTIEPGTLSLFSKRMEETDAEVVRGSFRKIDCKGNVITIKHFPDDTIKGDFAYSSYIEKYIKGYFNLAQWNSLFRLDFLRLHNIYCSTNYRKHESVLFVFKTVLYAQGVSFIQKITYNWTDNPTGITNFNRRDNRFLKDFKMIIESVIETKNEFESCHKNQPLLAGIIFLISYISLTMGFLRSGLLSEVISKKEKKQFLKWLKKLYRDNNMNLRNITGPFNRLSYLILISPFPYLLFRFYFKHLKTVSKIVNRFGLVKS
jgi:glycosyltransferase involved in cell wall biosynthesis